MTAVPLRRILHAEDRPPTEVVLPDCGRTVAVPAVLRRETRWSGDLPANFRAVPGKPAVAFGGRPLYPEFVILRLLEDAGWSSVWVNNWGGGAFWTDIATVARLPPVQAESFRRIEERRGSRRGCWDIFAWRGDEILFVESKGRGSDRIRPGQAAWLEAALGCGLAPPSFLIAEYAFGSPRRAAD